MACNKFPLPTTFTTQVINGYLLSQLGLRFASAQGPPFQYYLDTAFVNQ